MHFPSGVSSPQRAPAPTPTGNTKAALPSSSWFSAGLHCCNTGAGMQCSQCLECLKPRNRTCTGVDTDKAVQLSRREPFVLARAGRHQLLLARSTTTPPTFAGGGSLCSRLHEQAGTSTCLHEGLPQLQRWLRGDSLCSCLHSSQRHEVVFFFVSYLCWPN